MIIGEIQRFEVLVKLNRELIWKIHHVAPSRRGHSELALGGNGLPPPALLSLTPSAKT